MSRYAQEREARRRQARVPTAARPGSEDKVRLLVRRASLGLPLFVPGDFLVPDDHHGGVTNAANWLASWAG